MWTLGSDPTRNIEAVRIGWQAQPPPAHRASADQAVPFGPPCDVRLRIDEKQNLFLSSWLSWTLGSTDAILTHAWNVVCEAQPSFLDRLGRSIGTTPERPPAKASRARMAHPPETAFAFRVLRQPTRPSALRPAANSGAFLKLRVSPNSARQVANKAKGHINMIAKPPRPYFALETGGDHTMLGTSSKPQD